MSGFKYIRFEDIGFVIFEKHVPHSTIKQLLNEKPLSAGFCDLPEEDSCGTKASCFGESVSLNLKAAEKDTELLQRKLNPFSW